MGLQKQEVLGHTPAELFGQERFDSVIRPNAERCLSGEEVRYEAWIPFPVSGSRYMAIVFTPHRGDSGSIEGLVVQATDITEHKRAEQTLQKLFEALASSASHDFFQKVVVCISEWLGCECVHFSEVAAGGRVEAVSMVVEAEMVQDFSFELAGSPCQQALKQGYCAYPTGVTDRFPGDQHLVELGAEGCVAISVPDSEGEAGGILCALSRHELIIPPNAENVLRKIVSLLVAERNRRKIETALRKSERKFRSLFEQAGGYCLILDPNTSDGIPVIVDANEAACRIHGYTREEFIGRPVADIDDDEGKRLVKTRTAEIMTGKPFYVENIHLRKDGTTFPAAVNAARIDIAGEPPFILSVEYDLTAHRKMQERLRQSEKMTAIGQLAGGIAHDFNNQLAGILGYAELLKNRLEDEKLSRFAANIKKSAGRANELTKQLLAFSRKGKNLSIPVCLHDVIAEVADILEHSIDKRIAVQQNLKATNATIMGDPDQLQNALLNIAINARDAMPEGGGLLFETETVTLTDSFLKANSLDLSPGTYLKVSITDSGCGMDAETQKHIFEPFFTTKKEGKGTGMGLASVYGAIRNHKGAVNVYSEVGQGSTFRLYLPLAEAAQDEHDMADVGKPITGSARILLVDDEEIVREIGSDMLGDLGYTVTTCRNGREAVAHYQQHWQDIDLVILDMVMPELDGRDTFAAMKMINPNIRAILSSGYSINGKAQRILDDGVMAFIGKPFELDKLAKTVAQVLQAKR